MDNPNDIINITEPNNDGHRHHHGNNDRLLRDVSENHWNDGNNEGGDGGDDGVDEYDDDNVIPERALKDLDLIRRNDPSMKFQLINLIVYRPRAAEAFLERLATSTAGNTNLREIWINTHGISRRGMVHLTRALHGASRTRRLNLAVWQDQSMDLLRTFFRHLDAAKFREIFLRSEQIDDDSHPYHHGADHEEQQEEERNQPRATTKTPKKDHVHGANDDDGNDDPDTIASYFRHARKLRAMKMKVKSAKGCRLIMSVLNGLESNPQTPRPRFASLEEATSSYLKKNTKATSKNSNNRNDGDDDDDRPSRSYYYSTRDMLDLDVLAGGDCRRHRHHDEGTDDERERDGPSSSPRVLRMALAFDNMFSIGGELTRRQWRSWLQIRFLLIRHTITSSPHRYLHSDHAPLGLLPHILGRFLHFVPSSSLCSSSASLSAATTTTTTTTTTMTNARTMDDEDDDDEEDNGLAEWAAAATDTPSSSSAVVPRIAGKESSPLLKPRNYSASSSSSSSSSSSTASKFHNNNNCNDVHPQRQEALSVCFFLLRERCPELFVGR